jgi:hypothetical protein
MDKRQEELLESIRFLLAEFESPTIQNSMDDTLAINPPQLVGCKICFIGEEDKTVYKYNYEFEFEPDPESNYLEFI